MVLSRYNSQKKCHISQIWFPSAWENSHNNCLFVKNQEIHRLFEKQFEFNISSLRVFQALISAHTVAHGIAFEKLTVNLCALSVCSVFCGAGGSGEWSPIMGNYVMEVLTTLRVQYR